MIGPYQVEAEIEAAFSLLAFVLLCIPLYWQFGGTSSNLLTHSRLRLTILYVYLCSVSNIGCVLYMFWAPPGGHSEPDSGRRQDRLEE